MQFSTKNLLVILSAILLITTLTDAKPCDGCDLQDTVKDHAKTAYNAANQGLSQAWGWMKKTAHQAVTVTRRGLQTLEDRMSQSAEISP
ncbi:unnamed protein product [Allacma fusca]|uniref:Uncharacterized protein n=1 Tax=Allacma fusca TaxID=39272 RepID=A0A8J2LDD0_9HEXA|nr:unnamed protein product [Allacma fusca]